MQRLGSKNAGKVFEQYFLGAKEERFKAELLDYYATDEGASLEAYRRGNTEESIRLLREDKGYAQFVAQSLRGPITRRVHVIDDEKELTDYLKWEIKVVYRGLLMQHVDVPRPGRPLGGPIEEVQLAAASLLRGVKLPSSDFWILDREKVVQFEYDQARRTTGASVWTAGEDISLFLEAQQQLLAVAEPI